MSWRPSLWLVACGLAAEAAKQTVAIVAIIIVNVVELVVCCSKNVK
jgi:hypothetical protein